MTRVLEHSQLEAAFAAAAAAVKAGSPEVLSGRVQPVSSIATMRLDMGLTREQFAARYHVPIETLEGWERGTVEPDAVARAFLALIAADPDGAARSLASLRAKEAAE